MKILICLNSLLFLAHAATASSKACVPSDEGIVYAGRDVEVKSKIAIGRNDFLEEAEVV